MMSVLSCGQLFTLVAGQVFSPLKKNKIEKSQGFLFVAMLFPVPVKTRAPITLE